MDVTNIISETIDHFRNDSDVSVSKTSLEIGLDEIALLISWWIQIFTTQTRLSNSTADLTLHFAD